MKCPVCSTELKIAERQGVEIDYCPQCRGVWLDRGELDKLIDRSRQIEQAYDLDDEDRDEERYERERREDRSWNNNHRKPAKKRRESFLGDMFDIFG